MTRNWAVAIGINSYNPNHFAPLRYAKRDAEQMRDFFGEAGFNEVCFFSDDSPPLQLPNGASIPTYPSYGNLLSFLEDRFERPFLSTGDNCWFFFAGHGVQSANRDYLMPIDANPRNVDRTAIPVSYVRERLSRCGADNVILMLDACRSEGGRDGRGIGGETQQGIITISACSPTEKSWEIEALQQGAFTHALLEALRLGGERNCATVERLSQYLRYRVPDLCKQHHKAPAQTPRISADPAEKLHFILRPQFATLTDLNTLKNDAYRAAQLDDNLDLAEQIWIRVLATSQGRDMEAIRALQRIALQKEGRSMPRPPDGKSAPLTPQNSAPQSGGRGATAAPKPQVPTAASQPVSQSPVAPTPLPSTAGGQPARSEPQYSPATQPQRATLPQQLATESNTSFVTRQKFLWLFLGGAGLVLTVGGNLLTQRPDPRSTSSSPNPEPLLSSSGSLPPDGIDYTKLEKLLQAQQWKEADQETLNVMLKIAEREQQGFLGLDNMRNFPCDALRTIDQLWVKHSSGQFGFSVQRNIYVESGGALDGSAPSDEVWQKFGDRVGWLREGQQVPYDQMYFDRNKSLYGELPRNMGFRGIIPLVWVLFSRAKACEV